MIFWKKLTTCTCNDDPYDDACDYCLAKRGISGYFKEDEIKIINTRKSLELTDTADAKKVKHRSIDSIEEEYDC